MLVTLLAALTANLSAQYVQPMGVGDESCRAWVEHHGGRDPLSERESQWLAGYLTAFNTYRRPPLRRMSFFQFDLANVEAAVTSYCRDHQDRDVFSAVRVFVDRIQGQGGKRPRSTAPR